MASDPSYYPQQQQPYNGSAPQSRPPQGYQQPSQPYPPQGQEQYPQEYGNGYAQDYTAGPGYNGNGGRGNGYPPQQDYYGDPRAGGMPPQNRGRGGPAQRPPPGRGGDDQRGMGARGYGPPGGPARGGRPGPQDYPRGPDPGSRGMRNPMKTPPMSPGQGGDMSQRMANMQIGPPPGRGRPVGGPGQRNYPPQGYGGQQPGPPSGPGYGAPRQNGYAEPGYGNRGPVSPLRDNFAPPGRSMTMPMNQQLAGSGPGPNDERPYNGPVGRGIPPRPSTATGARPPPQRVYPPASGQYPTADPYSKRESTHDPHPSISEVYDAYYDPRTSGHARSQSTGEEMPNFEVLQRNANNLRRQQSIEEHIKPGAPVNGAVNGYQGQVKPVQSQPDLRARAQPQAAVFEMAGEAPPLPDQYQQGYGQGYPNEQYPAQNGFQPPPRNASTATKPGPVRPGLASNSTPNSTNQINARPPPVRNYNNTSPGTAQQPTQPPGPAEGAPALVTDAELDQLRTAMRNNPSDQATQLLLARKLVEAGEVLVAKIPDQRARNKARERYVTDAHKLLKKLVGAGNPEAMFFLADCYGRGSLGLETDSKEAFSLYQSAAKAGHPAAAYRTAVCCEIGNEDGGGTRKDPMKAIQWYKRAATLGDPPAMYKMGMIQLKGLLGQPKNPREAVGWLKRAAERADEENPHALHELGLLYEQPQGGEGSIVRDEAYSLTLFQKAADLGYKFSQFRLGCAFEYGLFNLPVDPRQSIKWYSQAAVQEEHQSELALSGWYLTGSEGVLQQSDTEAYLWARKAAMAGLAKAEYAMGYFTEVGIGTVANLEDAKRWYWRAAAQNFPKARERLEDLKKGGSKVANRPRERISRSKVGKQNEGECSVM